MSDVFISYSHADRTVAEALANDLKARGFRVWWDAELVSSDDFYEVILEALRQAKVAIVIWTKASAKSNFVRDEARFALHLKKLIATREGTLDPLEIPFGFQGQHTDDVTNRDHIVRAIDKLGVKPVMGRDAENSIADWEHLKTTAGVDLLIAYLGNNPPAAQRQAALARLKELSASPGATQGVSPIVRSLTMSNWRAFFSGLTFQMPKFQLSSQGTWASLGAALTYTIGLVIVGFGLLGGAAAFVEGGSSLGRSVAAASILTAILALLQFVAWKRFSGFLASRNFVAATIMALPVAVLAFLLPAPIGMALEKAQESGAPKTGSDDSSLGAFIGLTLFASFLWFIYLIIRKFRAAR